MKKTKRRLKRSVRKTVGALFLASSVIVAAIPTGSYAGGQVEAANNCDGVSTQRSYLLQNGTSTNPLTPVSNVPFISDLDTTVYSTGGGEFQFVYVNEDGKDIQGEANKFAVILGYEKGYLENGTLEIPNTVDVYRQLSDNNLSQGNCLVGKSGNYLYYADSELSEVTINKEYESGKTSAQLEPFSNEASKNYLDGFFAYETTGEFYDLLIKYDKAYSYLTKTPNIVRVMLIDTVTNYDENDDTKVLSYTYSYQIEHYFYRPCLYSTISSWEHFKAEELYWYDKTITDEAQRWRLAGDDDHKKIEGIPVKYIGNQYVEYSDAEKQYKISSGVINDQGTNPDNGVFAGSNGANIETLITHENLAGIGDYAFYRCVALKSISFENGLVAIGNHAFDGCRSLTTVNMPNSPKLQNIGAYAFKNCPSLTGLYIPHSVNLLCDGVFYGCTGLTHMDLSGDINQDPTGNQASLKNLGYHIFYGCSGLKSVVFPTELGAGGTSQTPIEIDINILEDCPNLTSVTVLSPFMTFGDDSQTACGFSKDDFHDLLVSDEFYFEGVDPPGAIPPKKNIGSLHKTCQDMPTDKEFTFKYYGQELYEKTVTEEGGGKAIYQVDNTNTLVGFDTDESNGPVNSLKFPAHFGPYYINEIPADRFRDNSSLTSVRLPSTINIIGASAFQGCYNLERVYFGNDKVQIGDAAFWTQQVSTGPCPPTEGGEPDVKLYFVTSISEDSTPFAYAMSDGGKYNHNNQKQSWPIIYSGFPTLLEVQYNPDKKCAELTNFPTGASLDDYTSASTSSSTNPGWYLSQDEKNAIDHYLDNLSSPSTTYDYALKDVCETLTIPRGVRSIQDGLFNKNTSSSNKIAVVSEGLTEIDVYYEENPAYEEVTIGSGKTIDVTYDGIVSIDPTKGDFANCEGLTSITFQGNSANSIIIPDYAFSGCSNLESVSVVQKVDYIGEQAFSDCDNLSSVELYGVKEIKQHAFYGDDNLTSVTVSADTDTLGLAPFRNCGNLRDVNFGDNSNFTSSNGIIYALDLSGNKSLIIEVLGGKNTIQATDVKGITGIFDEAFADSGLQIANFEGSSIVSIPEFAFDNCNNLVSVYLPEGCNKIKNYAFRGSALCNLTVYDPDLEYTSNALDLIESTYDYASGIDHGNNQSSNENLTVFAPADVDENGNITEKKKTYIRFEDDKYLMQVLVPIKHYYITYWDFASADDTKRTVVATEEWEEGALATVRDPERFASEGFVFQYYENRDDTDQTYVYRDRFIITSDVTLQAVYEGIVEETYTATFYDTDPDTGNTLSVLLDEVPVHSKDDNGTTKYYINSNQIALLQPTDPKPGYVFQTWTLIDPRNENLFTLDDVIVKEGVICFYAKYKAEGNNEDPDPSPSPSPSPGPVDPFYYIASYYMPDGTTLYTSFKVKEGDYGYNIKVPDGYTGYEWSPKPTETLITSDQRFVLVPAEGTDPAGTDKYNAVYYYPDGVTVYQTLVIEAGATPPDLMMPDGYAMCKWSPDPTAVVMSKNMRFTMVKNPDYVEPTPTPSPEPSPDPGYTGPYYTLTVVNGSGSGSYKPGAQVIIVADNPKTGTEFSSWTVSPEAAIASKVMSATVLTMPNTNVTVTANFVASTSGNNNNGSSGSGSGTNNNGNGNGNNYWPSTGNVVRSSGTTVVIEKNGLSNTGVVSATVNGSSDNFTIKITQSQTADREVLDALLKKYGSVDNLVYFPMDISLYDAAGTTQIRDTSGLTITITLPLPDSMIQYAANNKVAVVANGELDGLNARFTTINGVPCVTFTCTHFSPYVIYVNTVEMTAGGGGGNGSGNGTGLDNTPKTADFIHPKWFVSLALFAISIVLFLMKDKKTLKPVKAQTSSKPNVRK